MITENILSFALFIVSTFVLVKSADYFIINAEKLGSSLKWSHFLTGVLVVAVGTSLPELATSVASILRGETDMVIGNVLGSNIANIFLGLGMVFFLCNKTVLFKHNIFDVHFPVLIMAMSLATITMWDGEISVAESYLYFAILMAYLWFLFAIDKKEYFKQHEEFSWKYVFSCGVGLIGLIVASHFTIDSVITIAENMGLAKTALSATLIAVGTSLPEMMVAYSAVKRNNIDMIVGNILGSNIFNILLILGVSSAMTPLEVSPLSLNILLPFCIMATLIYWMISIDQKITKQEGLAMTFLYILFLGKLFGWF